MRREEYIGREVIEMKGKGTRVRERHGQRWIESVKDDFKEKGLGGLKCKQKIK